jgi:hypothetical protein
MAIDDAALGEFIGRFVTDLGATVAAGNVVVGHRLGLYRALAAGPASAQELASGRTPHRAMSRSGCAEVGLAAGSGLRWGECVGLRWDAVDLARGELRVVRVAVEVSGWVSDKPYPKSRAGAASCRCRHSSWNCSQSTDGCTRSVRTVWSSPHGPVRRSGEERFGRRYGVLRCSAPDF